MAFSRFEYAGSGHSVHPINSRFTRKKGLGMIAIKAASERWSEGGDEALFNDAESKIYDSGHLELIERIDLSGLEEQHSVIVVRKL